MGTCAIKHKAQADTMHMHICMWSVNAGTLPSKLNLHPKSDLTLQDIYLEKCTLY